MIWKQDVECATPADLKELQSGYLRKLIPYIYGNCPVYRQKLDAAQVTPDRIKSIDDIKRLPVTTKEGMRDNYPFGLFCVPQERISEIHVSSGTTGNPTLVGYTKGQDGELVITTLTKQGIPLLRYATRDIVSIRYDKCRCGRTSPRISKIKERTDDMIVAQHQRVPVPDRARARRHRGHPAALPDRRGPPGPQAR